ncbi:MAG: xanthine dehydrogenase family protein molybdopterin-binding subunit [Chloroflexi bacterium]|nr:xanthine dehydrogenase family protein molybdopterin-binding subunit [Chloroflexota bacterium]
MTTLSVVGTSARRIEGALKVTGAARFGADASAPDMLWCRFVRSPLAHARIRAIDTSRAQAVAGVHAVITAQDIPSRLWGRRLQDVPVLARDRVRFIGEKVAAVAAEDPETAERAAALVEVDYEELPAVFDAESALKGEVLLHPMDAGYDEAPTSWGREPNVQSWTTLRQGDVERAMAEADRVVEHEFRTQPVHQGYLEPHAYFVRPDASGQVALSVPNKMPMRSRELLAQLMDLPEDSIDIHPSYIGGDFGGKGSLMDLPAVVYLARRTRRPVKYVMSYAEELAAANPRHSGVIRIKSGLRGDGTLLARQATVLWDAGAYGGFKPSPTVSVGGSQLVGSYHIPNYQVDVVCAYTNSVPRGHARAPGAPQCYFASESHMDMLAHAIDMDPVEFRLKNAESKNPQQRAVVQRAVAASDWSRSRPRWHGRGIAVGNHGVGTGAATIRLTREPSGHILIQTGLPDTGTGALTVLQQVVAESLGVAPALIEVQTLGTLQAPPDSGAGASRVTHVAGQAALGAARALGDELARRTTTTGPITVEFAYESQRGSTDATGYIAQVADVRVDPDTGQVIVDRLTTSHEVGTIVNPLLHQGQIEGGIIQGFGLAVMEDLAMLDGHVTASHLGELKLPTVADIPELATELVGSADGPGPFAAKAIGESSNILTAAAIANAVYDACRVRITDLPITAEKVYDVLHSTPTRLET